MTNQDLQIGDIVKRTFAENDYRYIQIQEIDSDIKNGREGISGLCIGGMGPSAKVGDSVWAYTSSLECIVKFKEESK